MSDATSFYTATSKHGDTEPAKGHTYKQSGVDIREAASLVGDIGQLVKRSGCGMRPKTRPVSSCKPAMRCELPFTSEL